MKKNLGIADRIIRLIVAAVVVWLYYAGVISGTLGIVLIVVSAVLVLTSLISFCPLYFSVGLSSLKKDTEEQPSKPIGK